MSIVVLGAVFVDIKGYPTQRYIPGGRNTGRVEQVHGGVSRNIAEDIANLQMRPVFLSLVDDTAAGEAVLRQLERHKVDTRYIRKVKDGMGTWLAIFNNDGDVVAAISKRPDLMPLCEVLDEHGDEIFSRADSVLLEIDMEKDVVTRMFRLAERYHVPVYAAVSNMSIAVERRDLIRRADCVVCNLQEAGILFSEEWNDLSPEALRAQLAEKVQKAGIKSMVITLGGDGSVYADVNGESGIVAAMQVDVKDTTGAGDAFFAGTALGLTCKKSMQEACYIGTRLAAGVITSTQNVCPRFMPQEFGLTPPKQDQKQQTP